MNEPDLLDRLAEDVPTERLRRRVERAATRERRRGYVLRAAVLLVAALALGLVVRLATVDEATPETGITEARLTEIGITEIGTTETAVAGEGVLARLDAIVELLGRERLSQDEVDLLIETARTDPSVNVRLLSIDALQQAGVDRSTFADLSDEQAPIVRARLDAVSSAATSALRKEEGS